MWRWVCLVPRIRETALSAARPLATMGLQVRERAGLPASERADVPRVDSHRWLCWPPGPISARHHRLIFTCLLAVGCGSISFNATSQTAMQLVDPPEMRRR